MEITSPFTANLYNLITLFLSHVASPQSPAGENRWSGSEPYSLSNFSRVSNSTKLPSATYSSPSPATLRWKLRSGKLRNRKLSRRRLVLCNSLMWLCWSSFVVFGCGVGFGCRLSNNDPFRKIFLFLLFEVTDVGAQNSSNIRNWK